MKITAIDARRVAIKLTEPFVISLGAIESADTVIVRVRTDEGLTGYGEGSATPFVTGETPETVLGAIAMFTPAYLGQSPFAIEHLHAAMDAMLVGNGSAKAALDMACYDIMAQAAGVPLYRFLGGVDGRVETDMTIGLDAPDAMAAKAATLASQGYRQIKVKAGSDDEHDRTAISLIRAAAPDAHLKVDANQGWTVARALAMLDCYREHGVQAVEQPLPYWDVDGLAYVRARSPLPIMADEACFTPHDASTLVRHDAADVINIKLMKCGGIYKALQINAIAEAAGVGTMLGCMLESSLAIAAGAHLVASRRNFVYADLDSFKDFDDSSVVASAFGLTPPFIELPDTPGLGVTVREGLF